jgi:peptidoglycan/LPS O-acetylase OafA/YrhL
MQGSPRFEALTGARFVAALAVVVYHLWRDTWSSGPLGEGGGRLIAHGPIAVSFFFVLSGFVLSWSQAATMHERPRATSVWIKRARRLLPMFGVSLVVSVPVALALARIELASELTGGASTSVVTLLWPRLVAHVCLVQAWIPGFALVVNPPVWSLSVEVAFAFFWPWLWGPLWSLAGRRPWALLAALWAWSIVPTALYLALQPDGVALSHKVHAFWLDVLRYHPLVRLPELLAGVVLARLVRDGYRPPPWSAAAGAASVVAAVMLIVAVVDGLWGSGPSTVLTHNGLLLPAFSALIVGLATAPSSRLARVLSTRPLIWLGDASYALYVLHVPLLYWVAGWSKRRRGDNILEEPGAAVVVVVVIVLASVAVYMLVEARVAQRFRRRG